jgi:hypothetical protein
VNLGHKARVDVRIVNESGEPITSVRVGDEFIVTETRIRINGTFNRGLYQEVEAYTVTHTVRQETHMGETV